LLSANARDQQRVNAARAQPRLERRAIGGGGEHGRVHVLVEHGRRRELKLRHRAHVAGSLRERVARVRAALAMEHLRDRDTAGLAAVSQGLEVAQETGQFLDAKVRPVAE
jgi:hypothetical protein